LTIDHLPIAALRHRVSALDGSMTHTIDHSANAVSGWIDWRPVLLPLVLGLLSLFLILHLIIRCYLAIIAQTIPG
jgi:hypothetical protein